MASCYLGGFGHLFAACLDVVLPETFLSRFGLEEHLLLFEKGL